MKKIATVSVLAIMAVSAARADIASTTYVDKTAAGAVTTGLADGGNIKAAITAATNDMATQDWVTNTATAAKATADADGNVITETYALKSKVGEVDLATTTYMKNDSDLTAAVKSLDSQLSNVAGGNLAIKSESITATEIKNGAVGTDELADGAVTDDKLGADVKEKYATKSELPTVNNAALTIKVNGTQKGSFTANADTAAEVDIPVPTKVGDLENDAGYQNADQVSTAISTATASGVIKTALDGKVNTADVANLSVSHAETAGSATTAAGYTTDGAIAQALAGKVDDSEIANMAEKSDIHDNTLTITVNNANGQTFTANAAADKTINIPVPTKVSDLTNDKSYQTASDVTATLGDYYTKTQADTLLADKQDTTTAVTHTANTAVGDTTHAVYIDSTGAAKVVEKVASASAADSATKATQDASGNVITETYATKGDVNTLTDGLGSLADVQIPDLPGECKGDDATADCTLVIAVGADNALTAKWEKVAR